MEELVKRIRQTVDEARQNAYRAVNFIMVETYWHIGRMIVENEQNGLIRAEYGSQLIPRLSERLTDELGKGFSEQSLWDFRLLFLTFPMFSALPRELSWSHFRLLMRVEDEVARNYYLNEADSENWSVRTLKRQIDTNFYSRLLASQNKVEVKQEVIARAKREAVKPDELLKDPYVLEFVGFAERSAWLEKDLEQSLIDKLQEFMLELGKGFAFVGRQYRISTETKHFYVDLVFYNYLLKCFVLVDLKNGELTHQDIGQMDMYVRIFEDRIKPADDNPTIGIILCSAKDETVVKYSVLEGSQQLFASRYQVYMPSPEKLRNEIESLRKSYGEEE